MIPDNHILPKNTRKDNPHLLPLRDQADRLMTAAEQAGDDLRWVKHFQVWLALNEQINRAGGAE